MTLASSMDRKWCGLNKPISIEEEPMTKRARVTTRLFFFVLPAASFLLPLIVCPVQAQQSRPTAPAIKNPKLETMEKQNREGTLRSAELGAPVGEADQKRIQAAIEQIKEDFKRLQIVRNEMVRDLLAAKPLDYKLVAGQVEETNKRAARLRTYLIPTAAVPEKEGEKKEAQANSTEIKAALVRLCHLIDSFVENPALKNLRTNDAELSKKAMSDLRSLVDLSDDIKRSVDKLNKTTE